MTERPDNTPRFNRHEAVSYSEFDFHALMDYAARAYNAMTSPEADDMRDIETMINDLCDRLNEELEGNGLLNREVVLLNGGLLWLRTGIEHDNVTTTDAALFGTYKGIRTIRNKAFSAAAQPHHEADDTPGLYHKVALNPTDALKIDPSSCREVYVPLTPRGMTAPYGIEIMQPAKRMHEDQELLQNLCSDLNRQKPASITAIVKAYDALCELYPDVRRTDRTIEWLIDHLNGSSDLKDEPARAVTDQYAYYRRDRHGTLTFRQLSEPVDVYGYSRGFALLERDASPGCEPLKELCVIIEPYDGAFTADILLLPVSACRTISALRPPKSRPTYT